MGRRSKADQQDGSAAGFDTVGVTIMPGRPLPAWAEPAPPGELPDEVNAMAPEVLAGAAAEVAAMPEVPAVPEPVPAMAGVAAMASAAGAAPAQGMDPGLAWAATVWPSAPAVPADAGLGVPAMAGAPAGTAAMGWPSAAPTTAPGAPTAPADGRLAGWGAPGAAGGFAVAAALQAPTAPAPAAPAFPSPGGPRDAVAAPPAPAHPAAAPYGSPQAPAAYAAAPVATAPVATAPVAPAPVAPAVPAEEPQPSAPSQVWSSEERPQLSPEHVALLTWWAEMIRTGQLPGPATVTGAAGADVPAGQPAAAAPARPPRTDRERTERRRALAVAALILGAVVLAATALLAGPKLVAAVLGAPEPAPVPVTEVAMPAGVGDLVALPADTAEAALTPVLGLGLRPRGVTVTQAYGTGPDAPMVLAALASTAPSTADAQAQAATWAERVGATLGEAATGSGSTAGITCTAASDLEGAPAGSVCFWGDAAMRGQAYVAGADPAAALERSAQVRSAVIPS